MANLTDLKAFVAQLRQQEGVHLSPMHWQDDLAILEGVLVADGEGIVPPFGVLVTVAIRCPISLHIPRLRTFDQWVRREIDWHVFPDGQLCLDLPERWSDHVLAVMKRHGEQLGSAYAVEYFLKAARWLLTRHRYAYQENIVKWPPSWPGWAHDQAGHREYARSRHAA